MTFNEWLESEDANIARLNWDETLDFQEYDEYLRSRYDDYKAFNVEVNNAKGKTVSD